MFHYVRGGIFRKFVGLGPTAIYGEGYLGHSLHNNSNSDLVGALALNPVVTSTELFGSHSSVWGFGITQYIDEAGMQFTSGTAYQPKLIEGKESVMLKSVAPNPRCRDFRLKLIEGN